MTKHVIDCVKMTYAFDSRLFGQVLGVAILGAGPSGSAAGGDGVPPQPGAAIPGT